MTLGHTERHIGHTKVRLTARGRLVRNIIIAILAFLAYAWLNDITTPEQCKVPVEQMSSGCKSIVYS
jgi:hypothetical protein